jgi:N-acetylglucosaminyl-diphospho-decaprenol L-rhamnosyltransferase
MELSYCVVNTNARDQVRGCVETIRRTHPASVDHEIVVLDNASDDGSVETLRDHWPDVRLIAQDRRAGFAANLNVLMREAHGRFILSLNEDSGLLPGAAETLLDALESDPRAGAAGAMLLDSDGHPAPCAYREQGLGAALAAAFFLNGPLITQSGGERTREVGWVRTAAFMIRRDAGEEVGWFDEEFFFYSEDPDFQQRLRDAGWRILHVPQAKAVHTEQEARDRTASPRRVVQFHRGRDLYMRKHHGRIAAAVARVLWAWSYVPRAIAALVIPGHDPRSYWLHARQALNPSRGEGMREDAAAYNRRLDAREPAST